jgi:hypothetical protein
MKPAMKASSDLRNAANTAFWARREPNQVQELLAAVPAMQKILDEGQSPQALALASFLQEFCELKAQALAAQRANGWARSAEARKHVERDRRIHDLHDEGKETSIIAKRETLSSSQVRRILKKPRP